MSVKKGKGDDGEDLLDCDQCSKASGKGKRSMNIFQGRHVCRKCYTDLRNLLESNKIR